jgi:hypothetical protein
MAISITDDATWSKIVGEATLDNGGRIGDLLTIGFAHVIREQSNGKLTQAEAGKIYTALIPAAFNAALQYEATDQKHVLDRIKIHAEVEKHWGYTVTIGGDENLVLGSSTGLGVIDEQYKKIKYENEVLLPEQWTELKEKIDLLQSQDLEVIAGTRRNNSKQADNELTSAKNREVNSQQIKVLVRQVVGYDDDKRQKALTTLLNFSSIVGQDHEVPILPSIIASSEGVDELVRMSVRDNSTPYNSTPIAANIVLYEVDANNTISTSVTYEFNISLSFDLDNKLDYESVILNTSGSVVGTTWQYNPLTRKVQCISQLPNPPSKILYTIADKSGLRSYTGELSFDLIANDPSYVEEAV